MKSCELIQVFLPQATAIPSGPRARRAARRGALIAGMRRGGRSTSRCGRHGRSRRTVASRSFGALQNVQLLHRSPLNGGVSGLLLKDIAVSNLSAAQLLHWTYRPTGLLLLAQAEAAQGATETAVAQESAPAKRARKPSAKQGVCCSASSPFYAGNPCMPVKRYTMQPYVGGHQEHREAKKKRREERREERKGK